MCKVWKDSTNFHKNPQTKDGLQNKCKPCRSEYVKANRPAYKPTEANARARAKATIRNQEYVGNYLLTHPCVDCGNTDIRVLEFDHIGDDKIYQIGVMVSTSFSIARIQQEIEKCEVRCRNCHTLKTYERLGGTWRDKYYNKMLLGVDN